MQSTVKADLVEVDKALESSRDSGYDLTAAVGEVVDNSIDWGKASSVRIETKWDKSRKRIDKMAFADDGVGIPEEILPHVLSLGFSSGYGSRDRLGRFGVGLTLGTLAIAQRVDVYTQRAGADTVLHTHLDLDEVKNGEQTSIETREASDFPDEFAHLMQTKEDGVPFVSGTLVVWSKIDRLEEGGRYGQANRERMQELVRFLARAYRRFIDNGLELELDGKGITLHDPLFLLPNPRVIDRFGADVVASVVERGTIAIDGNEVEVTVTLLPEEFRRERGRGGRADRAGVEFSDLYIPDHEGRISFLRHGREINYDLVAKMLPGGKKPVDRFVGIEVSFPATLDEYFQVRNVKRGVVPVSKLRDELRKFLDKPIRAARKEIRRYWNEKEAEESIASPEHDVAEEAVRRAEQTMPRGRAGLDLSKADDEKLIADVVLEVLGAEASDQEKVEIAARLEEFPISIVDSAWPGKELLDVTHLNARAVVKVNQQHPLLSGVYSELKALADRDPQEIDPTDAVEDAVKLARKAKVTIDLLLMAYVKAESMSPSPEEDYGELRSDWGRFASTYLREAFKAAE